MKYLILLELIFATQSFASMCESGTEQSPVDLANTVDNVKLGDFSFDPNNPPDEVFFQLVAYKKSEAVQVHSPSEHKVEGISSDAEIHFTYQSLIGEYLIVSALIDEGIKEKKVRSASQQEYFMYKGSKTSALCEEGVTWIVFKDVEKSSYLSKLLESVPLPSREVQPLNERTIFSKPQG